MFEFFSKAPSGRVLTFKYVIKGFLEGKNLYVQELLFRKADRGNIWHSVYDPEEISSELEKHRWSLIEELGYKELH